jgi:hypothetical protein
MVVVRGRLAPEVGAVLMQALAAAREVPSQRDRGQHAAAPAPEVSAETPERDGSVQVAAVVGVVNYLVR